ncbi:hypothetical protein KsCSTR_37910 [Candidatus Kuenenia stuttgartiensis]|jgi:hypothetical protein|uniref:Uncharacterized protein n=1 Tax=Kuenenia stuttgartiensis TaxID=174633 RepID=Q1Q639_KUEST|nr:hypothetical protein KsCSTR_37910 [Candidatus Kuenenia stuttgartiensis]TVM02390.1 MAG: hypothetical protein CV080_00980 [Candidatus Kuenenia stuttgartiensis]CAJ73032.1 unknown protein [Candidatus Kuenenia stuttgartiensis]
MKRDFPKQSKVFGGNASEPDILKDILAGLKKEVGMFSNYVTIQRKHYSTPGGFRLQTNVIKFCYLP